MKTWLLALSLMCSTANANNVRMFTVDWSKDGDGDVQMCDDNYYNSLELLVPYPHNEGDDDVLVNAIQECGLSVKKIDWVSGANKGYRRFHSNGSWGGCDIRVVNSQTKKVFEINLGDGC